MMTLFILTTGIGLGLGVLASVIWVVWNHPQLPRIERIGLVFVGAGIVWGGINRVTGRPVDIGDVLLLAGIVLVLWRYFKHQPSIGSVK